MKFDDLYLWYLGNPSQPRLVGHLQPSSNAGVSLTYDPSWISQGFALSLDLPLVSGPLTPRTSTAQDPKAAGAVDDARPDRWGERVIRLIDRPKRRGLMEYLYYAGNDRFGALGVSSKRDTYAPKENSPLPRLENAQAMSDVVKTIMDSGEINEQQAGMIRAGSGVGGAKPKALIDIDGAEWVIKFFNSEDVDSPLVEHATMTLAAKAGIRTAETRPILLSGEHAIAIRRFDRKDGRRLHCLSASTAIIAETPAGQSPDFGYPALAGILRSRGETAGDTNKQEMRELFRRMVFNILMVNTDDHEKNHSLIVETGEGGKGKQIYHLAPAYDVLPTTTGNIDHQFVIGAEGATGTLKNAMSQCELFGMDRLQAAQEVARVIDIVNGWRGHFKECGVSTSDVDALAVDIDCDELLGERTEFSANVYALAKEKPRKRRGPFAG